MGSLRLVTLCFVFAVPLLLPVLVFGCARQDWGAITWRGPAALAYMILAANLVANYLHAYSLTRLSAGQASIFLDLQPALATAVGVAAGVDAVTGNLLIGGALALGGVILVQLGR